MDFNQKISNNIVLTILGIWLLIDTLNGYLINNGIYVFGSISFGEIFRIIFFCFLLLSIKLKNKDLFFLFIPYFLVVLCFIHYLLYGNQIVSNLNIAIKLSLPVLLFFYFKNNKYVRNNSPILNRIIYINAGILLVNLYISYFGFGFKNYGNAVNLGGTGFFYAGNEVSGLLLVIYSLLLYNLRHKVKKAFLVSFLFFVATLVLTSKAAIFGVLIVLLFYIILYRGVNRYKIALFIAVCGFFIYNFIYKYIILAINRWQYFINNYGAITYLTGGTKRWEVVSDYLLKFQNKPFLLLVGDGWSGMAEQNFIDLLEAYGIVGVLVYFLWIYWGFNIHKKLKYNEDKKYALYVFFLIIFVATLAGHIIQSAMIAPFIAILGNLDILSQDKRKLNW